MTGQPTLDARLRLAIDASIGWYEDLCALHGVGTTLTEGIWTCDAPPPPLHSGAVVVEPWVTAGQLRDRVEGPVRGYKDSFATVDLSDLGFEVLFAATWIHAGARPAGRPEPGTAWDTVTGADELAAWNALQGTTEVLLPAVLRHGHFRVLARHEDGDIVSGAVARLGTGVVDVSNVFAVPGRSVDWESLVTAVWGLFPGRALVGYERGAALRGAVAAGFREVGPLRVWVR